MHADASPELGREVAQTILGVNTFATRLTPDPLCLGIAALAWRPTGSPAKLYRNEGVHVARAKGSHQDTGFELGQGHAAPTACAG